MTNAYQWRIVGEDTWHSLYDCLWREEHGTVYWGGKKDGTFEMVCTTCRQKLAPSDSVVHYASYPYVKEEARCYCFEHSPVPIELRNPEVAYRGVLRLGERGVLMLEQDGGEAVVLAATIERDLAERGAWLVVGCAVDTRQGGDQEDLVVQRLTIEGPSGAEYCVYRQVPGSQEPQRIDEVWNVDGKDMLSWLKQWPGCSLSMVITYTPEIEQYPIMRYRLVDARRDGILWALVNTVPHRGIRNYWVKDFREGQAECNRLNREENARSLSSSLDEVASILKSVREYQEREQDGRPDLPEAWR